MVSKAEKAATKKAKKQVNEETKIAVAAAKEAAKIGKAAAKVNSNRGGRICSVATVSQHTHDSGQNKTDAIDGVGWKVHTKKGCQNQHCEFMHMFSCQDHLSSEICGEPHPALNHKKDYQPAKPCPLKVEKPSSTKTDYKFQCNKGCSVPHCKFMHRVCNYKLVNWEICGKSHPDLAHNNPNWPTGGRVRAWGAGGMHPKKPISKTTGTAKIVQNMTCKEGWIAPAEISRDITDGSQIYVYGTYALETANKLNSEPAKATTVKPRYEKN